MIPEYDPQEYDQKMNERMKKLKELEDQAFIEYLKILEADFKNSLMSRRIQSNG